MLKQYPSMNSLWSHHEEGPEHHEASHIQAKLEPAIASGQHRKVLLRQVVRSTRHHLLLDLLLLFSPADSGPGCFQLASTAAPCCRLLAGEVGAAAAHPFSSVSCTAPASPESRTRLGLPFGHSSLVKKPWLQPNPWSKLQTAKRGESEADPPRLPEAIPRCRKGWAEHTRPQDLPYGCVQQTSVPRAANSAPTHNLY